MKRAARALLGGLLAGMLLLAGCQAPPEAGASEAAPVPSASPEPAAPMADALPERIPADNCRNWYEIFVYSFYDGNGDGTGDLAGVTQKLDYVRDMGFTGVWLMPVMPSPSYHKYDVTDYYAVDPAYGTLADFDALIARAHALGIKVILDLPINHTSSEHPWFASAAADKASPYRDYYVFSDTGGTGYTKLGDEYYESRFVSTMPDLNLDSPAVRGEIEQILRFWLERGADGFRLDAVTSYYTDSLQKSIDFCAWLGGAARAVKPDCFIVGEAWTDIATLQSYYASGLDSFFCFPVASATGSIAKMLAKGASGKGESYGKLTLLLEDAFPVGARMAPFLGNHDMARIANAIGTRDLPRLKAATGLLAMLRGGLFYYYGDEIGMLGKGEDPNKRIGMLWTTEAETTQAPPGATELKYALPSVAAQRQDPASLLRYVQSAMRLRNAVPAIARGRSEVLPCADPALCVIRRTWMGETVVLVLNVGAEAKQLVFDPAEPGFSALLGALDATGEGIAYEFGTLTLPAYGIAVLQ